jgi:hypothetical protein
MIGTRIQVTRLSSQSSYSTGHTIIGIFLHLSLKCGNQVPKQEEIVMADFDWNRQQNISCVKAYLQVSPIMN